MARVSGACSSMFSPWVADCHTVRRVCGLWQHGFEECVPATLGYFGSLSVGDSGVPGPPDGANGCGGFGFRAPWAHPLLVRLSSSRGEGFYACVAARRCRFCRDVPLVRSASRPPESGGIRADFEAARTRRLATAFPPLLASASSSLPAWPPGALAVRGRPIGRSVVPRSSPLTGGIAGLSPLVLVFVRGRASGGVGPDDAILAEWVRMA